MGREIRLQGQAETPWRGITGAKARRESFQGSNIQELKISEKTAGPAWRMRRQSNGLGIAVFRVGFEGDERRLRQCGGETLSDFKLNQEE